MVGMELPGGIQEPAPEEVEKRVRAALDGFGVPYEVLPCDPEHADTASWSEMFGYSVGESANTVVVGSKYEEPKRYAACVYNSAARLDANNRVKRLMGVKKVSFAPAEETVVLTGMMINGLNPFALPPDLPLFVDEALLAQEHLVFGGGSRSCKIKVSPEVFHRIPGAQIVPDLTF
jgi:prolyl-tRNA editing enzyme YbaK/EbsC (Cys-tRNA(Pro) deacylase)